MLETKIDELLKKNHLSITGGRRRILELFLNKKALYHIVISKKKRVKNLIASPYIVRSRYSLRKD